MVAGVLIDTVGALPVELTIHCRSAVSSVGWPAVSTGRGLHLPLALVAAR